MKFGTSGLRGLVADMTDPVCARYAAGFLRHLGRDGLAVSRVLVGRDLRPSSPRIAAACLGAVAAEGAQPVDCGVVPTPALALEAARAGAPAIMVTGSHIPFDRNGLKFYRPDGEITKDDEAGITAALPAEAAPPGPAAAEPGAAVGERYLARATGFFAADALRGRRIGVWQHSAAGRDLTAEALARLGAEAVALGRTDGFVPVDTEAIAPEDAARIAAWVAGHRLDALVATDGDGDRPLIADETGAVLRGDAAGILTARALGADAVAAPLTVSTALERSGWFPRLLRTRIGSPHVIAGIERLRAEGAALPVGFEANGGFLLGGIARGPDGRRLDPLPTRDALVPILALLAAAAAEDVPLSRLAARLPARTTASDRLQEVPPDRGEALLAALADAGPARAALLAGLPPVRGTDGLDGLRLTLAGGDILHLRMSGNAPELRVYTEADTPVRAGELLALLLPRAAAALAVTG